MVVRVGGACKQMSGCHAVEDVAVCKTTTCGG